MKIYFVDMSLNLNLICFKMQQKEHFPNLLVK